MREALAFVRQDYLTASSYRMRAVFSLAGLMVTLAPLYFIARALQPVMARSIAGQGHQYFAFVLIGMIALRWVITAVTALPEAIANSIRSGTLEALFMTPVPMRSWVTGMMGYRFAWTAVESCIMLVAGALMGVRLVVPGLAAGILILLLVGATYASFGIAGAALILLFRTAGPFLTVVVLASTLLGGVYYPTHVIPSWIQRVSAAVPLSYGLRAMRLVLLEGASFDDVRADVTILVCFALFLLVGSVIALRHAVRYARRTGTLAQY